MCSGFSQSRTNERCAALEGALVEFTCGLRVGGIVHFGVFDPVGGFLRVRVGDAARAGEVPVFFELAISDLFVVHAHLVGVVRVEDERVQMRELIVLAGDVLLDQQILALVREDHMHFLLVVSADVRACRGKSVNRAKANAGDSPNMMWYGESPVRPAWSVSAG